MAATCCGGPGSERLPGRIPGGGCSCPRGGRAQLQPPPPPRASPPLAPTTHQSCSARLQRDRHPLVPQKTSGGVAPSSATVGFRPQQGHLHKKGATLSQTPGGAGGGADIVYAPTMHAPKWVAESLGASSRRPRHPFPALMAGVKPRPCTCAHGPKKTPHKLIIAMMSKHTSR